MNPERLIDDAKALALSIAPGYVPGVPRTDVEVGGAEDLALRSEEHTSELQSLRHLVCRLLLEKKKKKKNIPHSVCDTPHHPTYVYDVEGHRQEGRGCSLLLRRRIPGGT